MAFCVFIFFFLFRTNGKKEDLDENDFRHGYDDNFESVILKVTWYQQEYWWYQLCQSTFLTFTRHIDNGIWKTPRS